MRDILLVDEGDIEQAIVMLLEIEKTLVEGAGAASLAAVLKHRERFVGRLTRLIVEMRDLPGALSEVTGCLADLNANVEQISHQRAFTSLPVQTVEVEFVLQTRSHDHVHEIVEALARKGFAATLHLD